MPVPIILASGSAIRAQMLANARVAAQVVRPRVDEEAVKNALLAEAATPRNIADALAELKARKISEKHPGAMVIGCDQVLDFAGTLLSKPETPDQALDQLTQMRGKRHSLYSAAVIAENGRPVWRHIGQVRLHMRDLSDAYLQDYVRRNWDSIRHAVGAYKLEEEGVRLFSVIDGDYFSVLGMPLTDLLNYLAVRGAIET
ncbi:nucleoside triphosphate pyrophosphatase [Pseudooceanicola sp.]|uniref:Maf family protein n=1 Tax=Pseudooceanicola sp. TaxID=1914328 RepID=UPI003517F9DB